MSRLCFLAARLSSYCRTGWVAGVLAAATLAATDATAGQLQLLMFERDGCSYCQRWTEEIGPAYPRTPQGRAAPLERLDVTAPLPADVTLTGRAPVFTPTFVLLDDGTEVGRIEGYAGDEFFWVLLDRILGTAGWTEADTPAIAQPSDVATGGLSPSEPAPGVGP